MVMGRLAKTSCFGMCRGGTFHIRQLASQFQSHARASAKETPVTQEICQTRPRRGSAGIHAMQPFERLPLASRLDRLADAELQLGHHVRAEFLATRAAELRVVGDDRSSVRGAR